MWKEATDKDGVSITGIAAHDGPGKGVPHENLEALRTFLKARRAESLKTPEIWKELPDEMQKKLTDLLAEVTRTRYFSPRCPPKPEWRVFYARTWKEAHDAAEAAIYGEPPHTRHTEGVNVAHSAATEAVQNALMATPMDHYRPETCLELSDRVARKVLEAADIVGLGEEKPMPRGSISDASAAATSTVLVVQDRAMLILLGDTELRGRKRHEAQIRAEWDVWRNGYGCYAEVNGVLYVYCIGEPHVQEPTFTVKEKLDMLMPTYNAKEKLNMLAEMFRYMKGSQ